MMRLLLVVAILAGCSDLVLACTGCGCKGGPGYRGPDGRCVGWSQLNAKCGNPPTSRCTFEGKTDVAGPSPTGKGPYMGSMLAFPSLPSAAPPTTNTQKTRATGIGCVSQETLRNVSTCAVGQGRNCEQEKAELLKTATCAVIPSGIDVIIEAGSHSFEWLRVRVPGQQSPLWTDRSVVLDR